MTPERQSSPRRRAPQAPVHGRRPRPTSPAELLDDVIAELDASPHAPAVTAVSTRPAPPAEVAGPPTDETSWLVRRWSGEPEPAASPPPALPRPARRRVSVPRIALPAKLQRALGVVGIVAGVASLGLLLADVWPASAPADPSAATRITVLPRGSVSTLTMADAGALADPSVVPDASAVAPIVERPETVTAGSGRNTTATMIGSTAGWPAATGHRVATGRIFTRTEVSAGAHVAVLGSSLAQRLFPGSTATGASVTIAGRTFSVVGVLAASAADPGPVALVPVTSAQGITGTAGGRTVDRILVSAPSPDTVYTAYQEVNNLLLQTHHTGNPFATDFTLTAAAVAGGHSAGLLWGLGLLAAVAPLLGVMAILRLRRAA